MAKTKDIRKKRVGMVGTIAATGRVIDSELTNASFWRDKGKIEAYCHGVLTWMNMPEKRVEIEFTDKDRAYACDNGLQGTKTGKGTYSIRVPELSPFITDANRSSSDILSSDPVSALGSGT